MVYESDFYTTRRPYTSRIYPSVTSYSYSYPDVSSSSSCSSSMTTTTTTRQYRIVPSIPTLSKIHVIKSIGDNSMLSSSSSLLPYTTGNSRTTTYILPASTYHLIRVRPAITRKQICRIPRSFVHYLNNDPITNFEDETRLIRSQAMSLMRQLHTPVPRQIRVFLPDKLYLDRTLANDYIYNMLSPVRRLITNYDYRPTAIASIPTHVPLPIPIHHFLTLPRPIGQLSPSRPSRHFSSLKALEFNDPSDDLKEIRKERAERLAKMTEDCRGSTNGAIDCAKREKLQRRGSQSKNEQLDDEKVRNQQPIEQEIAETITEVEPPKLDVVEQEPEPEHEPEPEPIEEKKPLKKKRRSKTLVEDEIPQQSTIKKSSSKIEKIDQKEIDRLEELAREAEADREADLARQAEELAELARQEQELAELERQEQELAELERQERELAEKTEREKERKRKEKEAAELAELKRQEEELAELERQEQELAELERQEAELAAAAAAAASTQETDVNDNTSATPDQQTDAEDLAEDDNEAIVADAPTDTANIDADVDAEPEPELEAEVTANADDENTNLSKNHVEIVTTTKTTTISTTATTQSSSDNNECELIDNETVMMMDKDNEELDTSTNLKGTEMQDSVEKVDGENEGDDDDDATLNTEELEREEAEIVALAKKAVRLAALEAEAKALDAADEPASTVNEPDVAQSSNDEILA